MQPDIFRHRDLSPFGEPVGFASAFGLGNAAAASARIRDLGEKKGASRMGLNENITAWMTA